MNIINRELALPEIIYIQVNKNILYEKVGGI